MIFGLLIQNVICNFQNILFGIHFNNSLDSDLREPDLGLKFSTVWKGYLQSPDMTTANKVINKSIEQSERFLYLFPRKPLSVGQAHFQL